MVDENPVPPLSEWFGPALVAWLITVGALAFLALAAAWVTAVLHAGPRAGSWNFFRGLRYALADLVCLSPRRTAALAWLTVKESIRRKVVVVFAMFLLLAAFGGWFLDPTSMNLARLYITAVLTATTYLICALVIVLSALGLPGDIKSHTIYTLVTKPVRPSEIILGRLCGLVLIGTALLGLMCAVSYVFVRRGLNHTHEVDLARLQPDYGGRPAAPGAAPQGWKGWTTTAQAHRHEVYVDAAGPARLELENGHWHALAVDPARLRQAGAAEGRNRVATGLQQGQLVARSPQYGALRFVDRGGREAAKGVNVGDEWTYRTYIEGGTLGAAVWTFAGVTEAAFPNGGLPVELNIAVFRTHKGTITKGVPGSLTLRNPKTGLSVEARVFAAKEYVIDSQWIPRALEAGDGRAIDLFRDLTADGRLEIRLRCLEPQQYFGAAPHDCYLRGADASFTLNFLKGYFGVWLKMTVLCAFGMMFSALLSAPVAWLATGGLFVIGLFKSFLLELAGNRVIGGGTFESLLRIVTQDNMVSELEPGLRTSLVKTADKAAGVFLGALGAVAPDFGRYEYDAFVADGFNIPLNTILVDSLLSLAVVMPAFVAAYVFFKSREVAAA